MQSQEHIIYHQIALNCHANLYSTMMSLAVQSGFSAQERVDTIISLARDQGTIYFSCQSSLNEKLKSLS